MPHFLYTGNHTCEISFPLGGIGSGCIGLAGNGRLVDWEIFNKPNKGSHNGFSHFAIKAEQDGQVLDARVLNGDLHPPYQGSLQGVQFQTFGFGPRREYLAGLPHFTSTTFRGEFPLVEIVFEDDSFPGAVKLRAFNPFIPLNERDSSIPAAMFEIEVTNTGAQTVEYTLAGVLGNPLPANNIHHYEQAGGLHLLYLDTDGVAPEDVTYGNLTLATDAQDVSAQHYWFRGKWFDNLEVYWREFAAPGRMKDRVYERGQAGSGNNGMLAAHLTVAPGATASVRFVISWHFPNVTNYWNAKACDCAIEREIKTVWKNYYATQWEDSAASASYTLQAWDRLAAETRLFKETLFGSSLPAAALDAISANLSILNSPTVLRLEDGTFYGFEGCHPSSGCCEGSCTHVWNYAQALPFLFPALERSMRNADYQYNLRDDGGMPFRLQLPLGTCQWNFRPCVDGQMGGVLKVYRDWKVCGDTEWLRGLWPAVKASLEFAWSPANEDRWDPDQRGVMTGRQHHTLDMELFGPNSWLTGMYLGALKAAAEMAEVLGEQECAAQYRATFAAGKAWADLQLFNGEYYYQKVDLNDKALIEQYDLTAASMIGSTLDAYWNDEHGEIKYQLGEGCGIDQVLGQWHADLYGLGEIFDPPQVKSALASIYKYNFKMPFRNFANPCRVFALNDEGGLVIAAWPEGKVRPMIPAPYSQETMHGFEYAAAVHMIQRGLVEEGMAVVEAVRARYDGERRNPWNEFECGSNYARSMASYALLNAFSGFQFDLARGYVGFNPVQAENGSFRCLWSLDPGWGEFRLQPGGAELRVLYGQLNLQTLEISPLASVRIASAVVDGQAQEFRQEGSLLHFPAGLQLGRGQALVLSD
jgi:non-lysosomal glucosylceramidase